MSTAEITRLRAIENAAMRVASSRRNGIVTDQGALDRLDAALEAQPPPLSPTEQRIDDDERRREVGDP